MEIKNYEDMDMLQLDVIREIGSIGTGYAANALSSFLNEQVQMTIPQVSILGVNESVMKKGNPEEVVAAVLVEMSNSIDGIMLFIFRMDFMNIVFKKLLGEEIKELTQMTPMMTSAMEEIGNIMISSYINAISMLTDLSIDLSVPAVTVNMLGAILTVPMVELGLESDKIMMINGSFIIDGKTLDSELMLLPDVKSLNVLMDKLGVNDING